MEPVINKNEKTILAELIKIRDGLQVAVQTVEAGIEKENMETVQQGIATANILLYEGKSVKEIRNLMKREQYR